MLFKIFVFVLCFLLLLIIIILFQIRLRLGMAWPEEIDQTVGSTWYLKWQSEAEMSFRSRKTDDFQWFFWFIIRSAIYGYILFHIFSFIKRKVPRLLGYGPVRRNPNLRKLARVVTYCSLLTISYRYGAYDMDMVLLKITWMTIIFLSVTFFHYDDA